MASASRAAVAEELGDRIRPVVLAHDQVRPVHPAFETLLPRGLQRGISVGVTAGPQGGATTVALALAVPVDPKPTWVAVVGVPELGWVAASELGIPLERSVAVDCPREKTAAVVAALADGFATILVRSSALQSQDARRLAPRLREYGTVLIGVGGELAGGASALRLHVASSRWVGPDGAGMLTARQLVVEARGRGMHAGERRVELLYSAPVFPLGEPTRLQVVDGAVRELRALA